METSRVRLLGECWNATLTQLARSGSSCSRTTSKVGESNRRTLSLQIRSLPSGIPKKAARKSSALTSATPFYFASGRLGIEDNDIQVSWFGAVRIVSPSHTGAVGPYPTDSQVIDVGKIDNERQRPRTPTEPSLVTKLAEINFPEWTIIGGSWFRFPCLRPHPTDPQHDPYQDCRHGKVTSHIAIPLRQHHPRWQYTGGKL